MSLLKNIFLGSIGIKAATNVHLVEIALPNMSSFDKRKIKEQMVNMWIKSAPNYSIEERVKQFNRMDRLKQLNYLGVAAYCAGISSPVSGEIWNFISYPGANLPDQSDLAVNSDWFRRKRHINISVGVGSLDITNW